MNGWIEWLRLAPSLGRGERPPVWRVLADGLLGLAFIFVIMALDWVEAVATAMEGDAGRLLFRLPLAVMFAGLSASSRFFVHWRESLASRFGVGTLWRFGARVAATAIFASIWAALAILVAVAIRMAFGPLSPLHNPVTSVVGLPSVTIPLAMVGIVAVVYMQTRAERSANAHG